MDTHRTENAQITIIKWGVDVNAKEYREMQRTIYCSEK